MKEPRAAVHFSDPLIPVPLRTLPASNKCLSCFHVLAGLLVLLTAVSGYGLQTAGSSGAALQQDYEAALQAQSAGDLAQAETSYKRFLVHALSLLGNQFTAAGDYAHANALLDEGLLLDPGNTAMRLDYARESAAAGDLGEGRQLAQNAVSSDPRNAEAHLTLGLVLLQMKLNQKAQQQLEIAVALDSNYPDGLALARAYLARDNEKQATAIFREMLKGFGDTAQIHLDFGLAYAETGHPDKAISEFKVAIAKNDRLPGAHYSLGAAYMQSMGEIDFPLAIAEFRKEIQVSPNDFLSYSQLGYIALAQHRLQDAEQDLTRAASLNEVDPDVYLSLGQLYTEMKQPAKAEAALRKSIALTQDLSHNHYQVQRAHYLLARLLLQSGNTEQAKQQMEISEQLMKKIVRQNQQEPGAAKNPKSAQPDRLQVDKFNPAEDRQAIKQVENYRDKIAPAIADSYNNLGDIAASSGNFIGAVRYFKDAASWNPNLPGIDYNLGKAAYYAKQYSSAVAPLQQYVQMHPEDKDSRTWLAASFYALRDYKRVLQILNSTDQETAADQKTAYIYAESLIRTGKYKDGIRSLRLLEKTEPNSPEVHRAISEAEMRHQEYVDGKK